MMPREDRGAREAMVRHHKDPSPCTCAAPVAAMCGELASSAVACPGRPGPLDRSTCRETDVLSSVRPPPQGRRRRRRISSGIFHRAIELSWDFTGEEEKSFRLPVGSHSSELVSVALPSPQPIRALRQSGFRTGSQEHGKGKKTRSLNLLRPVCHHSARDMRCET